MKTDHECGALDLHEAGEVLDFVGGGQLASRSDAERKETLVHDGLEISARGIDGGGVARWPRAVKVSFRFQFQACPGLRSAHEEQLWYLWLTQ